MNGSAIPIQSDLSATGKAVAAAHDAPIGAAVQSAFWERRGFLQRLTRKPG
jgi:hypothetical protein